MYRAAALAVLRSGISFTDTKMVIDVASKANIDLEGDPDSLIVSLDGQDVSEEIRSEEVSHASSVISAISEVRKALVNRQRELGAAGRGAVLEGRDIGTVVFPNADFKFFVTAAPEARAQRRFEQERLHDRDGTFEETLEDINRRDQRDSRRQDSPLAISDDAIVIDTTELTIDEVVHRMKDTIEGHSLPQG